MPHRQDTVERLTTMLISTASQFRSLPFCFAALFLSTSLKRSGHRGRSKPSLVNPGKKPALKYAWRWNRPLLLPERRIQTSDGQMRIVAKVALSFGQAFEPGTVSHGHKVPDDCHGAVPARNLDGNANVWIDPGASSSFSGNGSCTLAFTVISSQKDASPSSSEDHVSVCLPEEGASLYSAEGDVFGMQTKEETLSTTREESAVCREEDISIFKAETARRKKISMSKKGKAPWKKEVLQCPDGDIDVPDENITVRIIDVPDENITDMNVVSSLLVREKCRRKRISMANKGKVPWNRGRQHSEETKQRIRARTIEAMQNPKVREKLRANGASQRITQETKSKIRASLLSLWISKKKTREIQESCVEEWKELIAETARIGSAGDEVYQWDSHTTIVNELKMAWELSLRKEKERKKAAKRKDVKNKTDHRTRISEAIKAKWADPDYRQSVQQGIRAYLMQREIQPGMRTTHPNYKRKIRTKPLEKKPQTLVAGNIDSKEDSILEATFDNASSTLRLKSAEVLPAYKHPHTGERLEKLKEIRASRFSKETRRREVIERARILMAEAKRAEKALEAAAIKDKSALGPLLETRRLLAEAARSFEACVPIQKKEDLL